jgi:hypothetical protein
VGIERSSWSWEYVPGREGLIRDGGTIGTGLRDWVQEGFQ